MKFEDIKVGQYFTMPDSPGLWLKTKGDAKYLCIIDSFGEKSFYTHVVPPDYNINFIICDENGKKIEPSPVHFDSLKVGDFFKCCLDSDYVYEKINPLKSASDYVCIDIKSKICYTCSSYTRNNTYKCDIKGNLL